MGQVRVWISALQVPVILDLFECSDWHKYTLVTAQQCFGSITKDSKPASWLIVKQILDSIPGLNFCSAVCSSDQKHSPQLCFES